MPPLAEEECILRIAKLQLLRQWFLYYQLRSRYSRRTSFSRVWEKMVKPSSLSPRNCILSLIFSTRRHIMPDSSLCAAHRPKKMISPQRRRMSSKRTPTDLLLGSFVQYPALNIIYMLPIPLDNNVESIRLCNVSQFDDIQVNTIRDVLKISFDISEINKYVLFYVISLHTQHPNMLLDCCLKHIIENSSSICHVYTAIRYTQPQFPIYVYMLIHPQR